jgi:hypothetical protein
VDKVSAELASQLEASGEDVVVEVVVELEAPNGHPPVDRADRQAAIAAMKESFREVAEPVERAILAGGGEITGKAWINRTLRARVPASCLQRIVDEQAVAAVDVPKPLELESA